MSKESSTRRQFPTILKTEVPYWSEIERMSARRAPLRIQCETAAVVVYFRYQAV